MFAVEPNPAVLTLGAVAYKNGHVVPYITRLFAASLVTQLKVAEVDPTVTVSGKILGAHTSPLGDCPMSLIRPLMAANV